MGEGAEQEEFEQVNTIVWDDAASLASVSPSGSRKVTLDTSVLRVSGKGYDKAVSVRVNNQEVPFTALGPTRLLTVLPGNDTLARSVDVITTANKVGRTTFFDYLIGGTVNTVSGPFKLVQQFVKLLMTTPGTDVFQPQLGGNMQNWVGQKIDGDKPQMLVAKTVMNVVMCASQIQLRQSVQNSPPDEMLSDVQVLNAQLDPVDPTVMNLSIRLNTFSGRSAFFSVLIGNVQQQTMDMVGEAPTFF